MADKQFKPQGYYALAITRRLHGDEREVLSLRVYRDMNTGQREARKITDRLRADLGEAYRELGYVLFPVTEGEVIIEPNTNKSSGRI
jgi:hypothetical protein